MLVKQFSGHLLDGKIGSSGMYATTRVVCGKYFVEHGAQVCTICECGATNERVVKKKHVSILLIYSRKEYFFCVRLKTLFYTFGIVLFWLSFTHSV